MCWSSQDLLSIYSSDRVVYGMMVCTIIYHSRYLLIYLFIYLFISQPTPSIPLENIDLPFGYLVNIYLILTNK